MGFSDLNSVLLNTLWLLFWRSSVFSALPLRSGIDSMLDGMVSLLGADNAGLHTHTCTRKCTMQSLRMSPGPNLSPWQHAPVELPVWPRVHHYRDLASWTRVSEGLWLAIGVIIRLKNKANCFSEGRYWASDIAVISLQKLTVDEGRWLADLSRVL